MHSSKRRTNISHAKKLLLKITEAKYNMQTFMSSGAKFLCTAPNELLSYSKLPCKRIFPITVTPLTSKLIFRLTPHCTQYKSLCPASLSIEKASYRCNKPISCTVTWALHPGSWVLTRCPWLTFIVTQNEITFRDSNSTNFLLSMIFVLELLTL